MFRCTIPEGVEVKISLDLIKPLVQNRLVCGIEFTKNSRYADDKPRGFAEWNAARESEEIYKRGGMKILDIQTRGKFMYWTFTDDWYMFSTFGMTGQWSPVKGEHPCLVMNYTWDETTSSTQQMVFNDPRHFGTIKFVHGKEKLLAKLKKLGWDPLNHGMEERWHNFVINKCKRTNKTIGELLMTPAVFAGVGNYIRAEALYLAKISPWRKAKAMSKDEITSLCQALVEIMNESFKYQGATILTYKDAYGAEGKYSSCFKVYGQEKDPLGNLIIRKLDSDKRTVHWCPAIQL